MSKFFSAIKAVFKWLYAVATQRFWMKLLSVLMALAIWTYIVTTTPTITRSKYLSGVSVTAGDTTALSTYGLSVATDVYSEYQGEISASIDVAQSQYASIIPSSVTVKPDYKGIRSAGVYHVPLTASCAYGTVTKLYPDTVEVVIENRDSRNLTVDVQLNGADYDSYWYDVVKTNINPQQITVSGPESLMHAVSSVSATIDVTDKTASFRSAQPLVLMNSAGETVTSKLLTKSTSTCSVRVEVYPVKVLKFSVDKSMIPIQEGYQIDSITFQPSSVTVADESALLDNYDFLPLDVTGTPKDASKSFTARISLSNIYDFKYMSAKQVFMTVTVSEETAERVWSGIPVEVRAADGIIAEYAANPVCSVRVTGPASAVEALSDSAVSAYIEVSEAGEWDCAVRLQGLRSTMEYELISGASVHVRAVKTQ